MSTTNPQPPGSRYNLKQVSRGRLLIVVGSVALFAASFGPWYAIRHPKQVDPCRNLTGSDYSGACQDESRTDPVRGFYWYAWAHERSWVPVLALAVVAAAVLLQAIPAETYRRSPLGFSLHLPVDMLALPIAAMADVFLLVSALTIPDPPSGGDPIIVKGSDVFRQSWALWAACACGIIVTAGAVLAFQGAGAGYRIEYRLAQLRHKLAKLSELPWPVQPPQSGPTVVLDPTLPPAELEPPDAPSPPNDYRP